MTSPFLKWAGGKRWLAASKDFFVPPSYERYVEPFLGSGAIFFHLKPVRALLSDINSELIELYQVVQNSPRRLQRLLEIHHACHDEEHYYAVRAEIPSEPLERAARTLYLNRTCWNGLYRVNLKGEFNVPIGTKDTVVFDGEKFTEFAAALAGAEIICRDFEGTINSTKEGDFLFVDPPYTVQHNLNGFIKYNEKIFSWADQIRLRDAVKAAISRKVSVVVTNADHASIQALYDGVGEYRSLARFSVLSGDSSKRGQTSEAIFSANLV